MQFETENALRDLDRQMNTFMRGEIFAHGSLEMRKKAIDALKTADMARKSARALVEMLRLTTSE